MALRVNPVNSNIDPVNITSSCVMDLVTVIIVNYNSGSLLTEAVKRVLNSTIPVQVIVVDNASNDESVQELKTSLGACDNLMIIENAENLGFSAANNRAVPYALGKFLLFLNPDCFVDSVTIGEAVKHFNQDSNLGMIGCLILNEDGTEQSGCRRNMPRPWQALMRVLKLNKFFPHIESFKDFNLTKTPLPSSPLEIEAISGAFMLLRRDAFELVGGWDEEYFLHCEDLDLCMRFAIAGFKILFVPDITVTHKQGSCSIKRPIFVEWHKHKGMVRFYRKFYKEDYFPLSLCLVSLAVYLRFMIKALVHYMRTLR